MTSPSNEQTIGHDPFLQRAIEHWLDSANELSYQPLFCQWLTSQGFTLKYSIRNTNFEQGKDVVAVSQNGTPHAYQLKGGNITLKRWRSEVKPEIEALIDCPVQHPDIDKELPHISYLVTNGEIDDSVRVEIVSLNEKKWKATPLHTWTRGDLLSGFQNMASGILPQNALMYKRLLELIFSDGNGFPNITEVDIFLHEILNTEVPSLKKEQRKRDIAAGALYATMIAGAYRQAENHGSTVRIMVLFLSLMFHLVDKYELDDKYWIESYRIIWNDIIATAELLESEINSDAFETVITTPFEKDLIPFRKHSAVSIVFPLKLSQYISGNENWKTILAPDTFSKYRGAVAVWGEASFIPLIFLALICKNLENQKDMATAIIKTTISQIIFHNGRKSNHPIGLIPPYYDLDFAVKLLFGLLEEEFEDNCRLSSYLLKPLIEFMARHDQKEFVSEIWQDISFMRFEEFLPEDAPDYYLWRIQKGENRTTIPQKERSWSKLVEESISFKGEPLPATMTRFPEFVPFFLSVFPFRANSETLGFLDSVSKQRMAQSE